MEKPHLSKVISTFSILQNERNFMGINEVADKFLYLAVTSDSKTIEAKLKSCL